MTEPQNPEPATSTPMAAGGAGGLDDYFRQNASSVTEDALTAQAKAAGHSDEAIQEAWARVRGELVPSQGGRAVRNVFIAYIVTFGILSLLMLVFSSSNRGEFMPTGLGGAAILGAALGAAFVASLVWIASRRVFWLLVTLLSIPAVLSSLSYSPGTIIWALVPGAITVALWRSSRRDPGTRTDLAILMSLPILLLIGVAGTCIVSGAPFPAPTY